MSTRVDPNLLLDIKKYGDVNVEACFNCGNCTAVCPLSTGDDNFPRRMIRLAQVGLRDELLSSKELWLCYNCGECSETCPRQAEPGAYMAAARRYAIANYDRSGLAKLLYTSPVFNIIFTVVLAIAIGLFLLTQRGPMATDSLKLFEFVPYHFVHNLGLVGFTLVGLLGLMGIINMITQVRRANGFAKGEGVRMNWLGALWEAVGVEAIGQKRYREDCEEDEDSAPWYARDWFVHAMTMWGAMGLLLATSLDFGLDIVGIKATGTAVPIWYPVRLLGTVAGLLFVYGISAIIVKRWQKTDKAHSYALTSDWIFLIMLWFSGVTGFLLELALYLPGAPVWGYWMFLVHATITMELMLLLPFTQLAHIIYRTAALYIHALKPVTEGELVGAVGTD